MHAGFLLDFDVDLSEAVPAVTFIFLFLFLLFRFSSSCILVSIAALAVLLFVPLFVPESAAKCAVGNGDTSVAFTCSLRRGCGEEITTVVLLTLSSI